jgi:peptide deformylase
MNDILQKKIIIFKKVLKEIPEIRYAGDPVLRQVASPATLKEGLEIGERLKPVLTKYRSITGLGRGVAAPQIGESKSVFVTFVDDNFQTFINPKIVKQSGKTNFYKEVCMSIEILAADVERPEWVVMEWTDEEGKIRSEKFDGFEARLYQHEEAHLRGRLCLDDSAPGGIEFITFDQRKQELRDMR